jgi:hypothetical protein
MGKMPEGHPIHHFPQPELSQVATRASAHRPIPIGRDPDDDASRCKVIEEKLARLRERRKESERLGPINPTA